MSFRRFLANAIIKMLSNNLSGIWETSPQLLLLLLMTNTSHDWDGPYLLVVHKWTETQKHLHSLRFKTGTLPRFALLQDAAEVLRAQQLS